MVLLPSILLSPRASSLSNKASINITDNEAYLAALYKPFHLAIPSLNVAAFRAAMQGFQQLKAKGLFANNHLLTLIDFSQPSSQKRLYVLDLLHQQVLFNTYVAHGKHSGLLYAKCFSNTPESLQSSLGFYATGNTYFGKNGYSLQLIGLERGINDLALNRSIVMHGAPYVSVRQIESCGYLGRSWGCPAIPENLTQPIIDTIKNGSCVFIYANNSSYIQHSQLARASN
jgi:hypothetical protein